MKQAPADGGNATLTIRMSTAIKLNRTRRWCKPDVLYGISYFQEHGRCFCPVLVWKTNLSLEKQPLRNMESDRLSAESCDWFFHSIWKYFLSHKCYPLHDCPYNVTAFITAKPYWYFSCNVGTHFPEYQSLLPFTLILTPCRKCTSTFQG